MKLRELFESKEEFLDIPLTPALKKLDNIFTRGGHEVRIVGGAVRDILLSKEPKDIDLASDATPVEMQKMLDSAGVKHIPTGIEHGTITAVINGEDFEITTLRADVETDGRHAEVEFVRSWEQDALRRDLTYNAMSVDFQGRLYDYHGGMDDLQNKVSKFVGDPAARIQEDYLRILRYFRFQGRLDNPQFEADTMKAIKDNASGLKKVSVERVWMEMGKILSGNNIVNIVKSMDKTGVLAQIGLSNKNVKDLVDGDNEIVNLARLGDASLGKRWKFSNADNQTLNFLVTNLDQPIDKKVLSDMIVDGTPKLFLHRWAQLKGVHNKLGNHIKAFEAPEFPVNGNDLMQAGVQRGPNLGKILNDLKMKWKASDYKLSKEDLLRTIGQVNEAESDSVGVIFGRFNPPHVGHKKAWQMTSNNTEWYVGTNPQSFGPKFLTGKGSENKDPLPFDIKSQAMSLVMPEVTKHITPSESWGTLVSDIYKKHGDVRLNVYTDEKWVMKFLLDYNGVEGRHGYYKFTQLQEVPTPRMASAKDLRKAVADNDIKTFTKMSGVDPDTNIDGLSYFETVKKYLAMKKQM